MAEPLPLLQPPRSSRWPAENVDTDQIVPARYLKVTDKEGLADALFRDYRFNEDGTKKDPPFILDRPEMQGRKILLVGDNFGTGSSREHAPWALRSWGIQAILSTSFADIFKSNALKNGVLPIVVDPATHAARCSRWSRRTRTRSCASTSPSRGSSCRTARTIDFDVDPFSKMMLMAGTDEIGYVLAQGRGDRAPGRRRTRPGSTPASAPRSPADARELTGRHGARPGHGARRPRRDPRTSPILAPWT